MDEAPLVVATTRRSRTRLRDFSRRNATCCHIHDERRDVGRGGTELDAHHRDEAISKVISDNEADPLTTALSNGKHFSPPVISSPLNIFWQSAHSMPAALEGHLRAIRDI